MSAYEACPAEGMPPGIVWTTPARCQGQTVEVSYSRGIPHGRDVNYEADEGDLYMKSTDHSDGTVTYFRRADSSR